MKYQTKIIVYFFFIFSIIFFVPPILNAQTLNNDSNSVINDLKCILIADCQEDRSPTIYDLEPLPSLSPSEAVLSPTNSPNEPSQPPNPEPTIDNDIPIGAQLSCPVISGRILCSSKITKLLGISCQHCNFTCNVPTDSCYPIDKKKGDQYFIKLCTPDKTGISKALDVAHSPGKPVYFPFIGGRKVRWTYQAPRIFSDNWILKYSTTVGDQRYWLQFHHSEAQSGKNGSSGEQAGKVCTSCWQNNTPHTHVQIGVYNGNSPQITWLDAAKKIKCP
ncbi:hypothetical protein A3J15_03030 [Candidatus Roizmanbacteria bacterium RIFCSPLOWO2_02_FULL_38_10]|uniref:Uncharacterized protein n=1 Tax=Candidatus Roizmanbacteria bacterium RIFCSPLOWO2_02_FULL_38_10 TaxID=1802074 RepID=A0A1F7JPC7_9BACT|nr:MAG: hypothetical protein A3J15_03030 [Candidatus Roizmanbacteria bacterium RIFCSPLOWO2_02_FULL_38_10]